MHSILTSSHHTAANRSRPRYKWCLQETAFVSVEGNLEGYRQSAAACVSLSKSTMSKTRTAPSPENQSHRLAPGVGGGGYLANLEFRVKSFFSKLFDLTANQPGGLRQSRQLLKKPPKPVKLFFKEKLSACLAEILKSPEELLSISWRAASNEAAQVSQAIILNELQNDYLPNPAPRR